MGRSPEPDGTSEIRLDSVVCRTQSSLRLSGRGLVKKNLDPGTVRGFGDEWRRFDQSVLDEKEHELMFRRYFAVFPWEQVGEGAVGMDVGCGSGRWARLVAPRVGRLLCIDPSAEALSVARKNLQGQANCDFFEASVDELPVPDGSLDFAYALGVFHHVPDTRRAIADCVKKLKPDAPLLLYIYYALENRPWWYRLLWRPSDWLRRVISRAPPGVRYFATQMLAGVVYWPLARSARFLERVGIRIDSFPLSAYRGVSFYTMRTDALDRFGTRLEHRFTAREIESMMTHAGLERIEFSGSVPYWCAVGHKRAD